MSISLRIEIRSCSWILRLTDSKKSARLAKSSFAEELAQICLNTPPLYSYGL